MKETEMYAPLKSYLENLGYEVHAEVKGADVMAKKNDEHLIIEMKTSFSLQLVYQLVERLKITKSVYAYIPIKKGGKYSKAYKKMCALLRRIEVGLITLDQRTKTDIVTTEFDPKPFKRKTNTKKKKRAIKEFGERTTDLNLAGSHKTELFTAYRQHAVQIALFLEKNGISSPKAIKAELNIFRTPTILQKNYYEWFERIDRGQYQVTEEFKKYKKKNSKKLKLLLKSIR